MLDFDVQGQVLIQDFFPFFLVLLRIMVPILLHQQQLVGGMSYKSGSTNHLVCLHKTLRIM